jgi:hypothetical protein
LAEARAVIVSRHEVLTTCSPASNPYAYSYFFVKMVHAVAKLERLRSIYKFAVQRKIVDENHALNLAGPKVKANSYTSLLGGWDEEDIGSVGERRGRPESKGVHADHEVFGIVDFGRLSFGRQ